ncbi:MAG: DNRLRE domain-containing protein, partial [Chloroflexi bacterium]|nr:DNRLRE domain-containing protein [Chloroflexota bacterium]
PSGAGVAGATLRLRSLSPAISPLLVKIYGLKEGWSESSVTWREREPGLAWAQPGAEDRVLDRDVAALAAVEVAGGAQWYQWDITSLVAAWVKEGRANHGLLLVGEGEATARLELSSREGTYPPELWVRFHDPTPTLPPTATFTPSPTGTPGPTMAPPPTPMPGAASYAPVDDTYISQWYTHDNYGLSPLLVVRQGDIVSSLLRFDLRDLAGAQIQEARLVFYVYHRSNSGPMYLKAYRVRRAWAGNSATWIQAQVGEDWNQAGCNGEGVDRDRDPIASVLLDAENRWFSLDVTAAVRQWVNDSAGNWGLVLKGEGVVSVQYEIASNEWGESAYRPRLVVRVGEPLPTATASPSPWPTWTPSATPTTTLTPTPGPTSTYTPTFTPGTPTATPIEPAAPTPTPKPGACRFEPVADTTLNRWGPTENLGDSPVLLVRQGDYRSALLRFDLSDVPQHADVHRGVLHLYIDERTNTGHLTVSAYAVIRAWREDQATWNRATDLVPWRVAGCNGAGDRATLPIASTTFKSVNAWAALDLTDLVRAWVMNPVNNQGVILKGDGAVSVEYELAARESRDPLRRPWLEVLYNVPTPTATPSPTPRDTATPTETSTPMPTTTATPTFVPPPTPVPGALQVFIDRDTYLDYWFIDNNYGQDYQLVVRQGDIRTTLLAADLSQIPRGAEVEWARLHLYITGRSNSGHLFTSVHQVYMPWEENAATWVHAARGWNWRESGCNQIGSDRAGASADEGVLDAAQVWRTYDVTELVRRWVLEPGQNHGLIIKGSGSTSVQYEIASREHPVRPARPWLEIKLVGAVTATPPGTPTVTRSATPRPSPTATKTQAPSLTPTRTFVMASPSATSSPATATAVPTAGTLSLSPVADTFLDSWAPNKPNGDESVLRVRSFGIKRALMRFSLDDLPPGAQIERALLQLRSLSDEDVAIRIDAVGLARFWKEREATWNAPLAGQEWASPGAEAEGVDRLGEIVAQTDVSGGDRWWEWDITALMRQWALGQWANHGLMLLCREAPKAREVVFAAVDSADPPRLIIDYSVASPEGQFTLSLRRGLNMVSVPFCLRDPSISRALAPIADRVRRVWTYSAQGVWQTFTPGSTQNTLTTLDPTRGYWFDMEADAEVVFYAGACDPPIPHLKEGWNFCGYPSLHPRDVQTALVGLGDALELVWFYDASDAINPWRSYSPQASPWSNDLNMMSPGCGYWILVKRDCVWTLP